MDRPILQKYTPLIHILLLVSAVLVVYSQVFGAGFMSWDDAEYVLHNKDIQAWEGSNISNWFRHFYIGNYHPLTMASYAIDYLIGAQEPFQYHLTNIILHIVNVGLLYNIIRHIQAQIWVAFFVALLFAIHPVQTESVSWVAERKNVLYAFFFLCSMQVYSFYLTEERKSMLIWVFLLGAAAMLSKPAAVVLPVALLAMDIWSHRAIKNKMVWLEKLPLFLLSVVMGLIAIKAQEKGQFLNQHSEYHWYHTIAFAGYAYVQYIVHLVVPVKLSVLYPYPPGISILQVLYSLIAIAIIALGFIAWKRKKYMLSGGILFYTVNIALVLQFVQFGEVLMADRYLYIPCIGIWLPLVYYPFVWISKRSKELVAICIFAALSITFMGLTFKRNNIWLSEAFFWEAVIDTFPESSVAQSSVGGVYLKQGNYGHALEHINEAIKLDDNNYKAWYNKGVVHLRRGEYKEAGAALDKCLSINEYPKALFSRALLYQQISEPLRALNDIEKVLEKEPENARAHFIKGNCLSQNNNFEQAILSYNKAVEYGDRDPIFYLQRGIAEIKMKNSRDGINDMGLVLDMNPRNADAWYWRGLAKQQIGLEPCHDLNQARNLGSKYAQEALTQYCNND